MSAKLAAKPSSRRARAKASLTLEEDLLLASLLSSRICHDLVGPIGELGNGVEFLSVEDQSARDHAMKVIVTGTSQARARLQFYRSAFGYGGSLGERVQQDELKSLTTEFLAGGRVQLDWRSGDVALDRPLTRLTLNLALIGYEALPRGGVMRVGVVEKDGLNVVVIAEGPSIKFGERAKSLLETGAAPEGSGALTPKEAPLLLTHRLAAQLDARMTFGEEPSRLLIQAVL